jgi:hypothetical protein
VSDVAAPLAGAVNVTVGSVESSTYVMESLEHADRLDDASVATPWNVVDESAGTLTPIPGEPNAAAVPDPAGVPVQPAFL